MESFGRSRVISSRDWNKEDELVRDVSAIKNTFEVGPRRMGNIILNSFDLDMRTVN